MKTTSSAQNSNLAAMRLYGSAISAEGRNGTFSKAAILSASNAGDCLGIRGKMLTLIKGGAEPKPIACCPRCGGRTFMDVHHSLRRDGKKITRGVKARACVVCVTNGSLTLI